MSKVIHFEIETKNPEQTIAFYEDVFGWQFQKFEGEFDYWLINTGKEGEQAIGGGLMQGTGDVLRTINTIEVASIEEFRTKVESFGGKVTSPTSEIPGVGLFAYCVDPQGIPFGIIELT